MVNSSNILVEQTGLTPFSTKCKGKECYYKQLKQLEKQIFDIKEYCSYHRIDRILDTLDGEPLEINNYVANYILNEILENQ